jgi:hypothetical protein
MIHSSTNQHLRRITDFIQPSRTKSKKVLYWCETLSLAARKKHKLRVFGNNVQRGIFGSRIHDITKNRRKLQAILRSLIMFTLHVIQKAIKNHK